MKGLTLCLALAIGLLSESAYGQRGYASEMRHRADSARQFVASLPAERKQEQLAQLDLLRWQVDSLRTRHLQLHRLVMGEADAAAPSGMGWFVLPEDYNRLSRANKVAQDDYLAALTALKTLLEERGAGASALNLDDVLLVQDWLDGSMRIWGEDPSGHFAERAKLERELYRYLLGQRADLPKRDLQRGRELERPRERQPLPDSLLEMAVEANRARLAPPPAPTDVTHGLLDYGQRLSALDGSQPRLRDFEGEVLLVNYWATWCPPCLAELPALQGLYESVGEEVTFFLISVDEDRAAVERFLDEHGYTMPVYLVEKELRGLPVPNLPTTYVIDRDGQVVYQHAGLADWSAEPFEDYLRRLARD